MGNEICIDSGMGFCWAAVPAQPEKDYKHEINNIVHSYMLSRPFNCDLYFYGREFSFYFNRLLAVPSYGLVQGRELIKMICRCAFNDSRLTDNESIVIMETCLDPRLDNILLEVNYNEGW